ncbi:hypothetical protein RHGRI_016707 [Rhododendron griersonianum]|uniref:Uncharacterized protein n=1 Tax=Rhododendron griersonianum TaxID=479676 RepID=A0AAV6JV48_9ERIC|nr:hypothetical protein RHGRI_016707 [Rhododendron griersonianum]
MLKIASADLRMILGMRSRRRAPVHSIIWHTRRVMKQQSIDKGSIGVMSNMIELGSEIESGGIETGTIIIGVNDLPPESTGEDTTKRRFTIGAPHGLQIFRW